MWRKFPVSLAVNYFRSIKPVTAKIRKGYTELIEPELDSLLDFEYVEVPETSMDELESLYLRKAVESGQNREYHKHKIDIGEITQKDLRKFSLDDSVTEKIGRLFRTFRINYYGQEYPLNGDPNTRKFRKLLETQVSKESKTISRMHKTRYDANQKFVIGVDPLKGEPWLKGALQDWTVQNVNLIVKIPDIAIDNMESLITNSVLRGDSKTFLKDQIVNLLGVTDSRAKLIARDQSNKLYGNLTELRANFNGWDFYEWSDSNDSRVRPDHRVLDGNIYKFSEPPVTVTSGKRAGERNNPGQDINDRCVALILFDRDLISRLVKQNDGSYAAPKLKQVA